MNHKWVLFTLPDRTPVAIDAATVVMFHAVKGPDIDGPKSRLYLTGASAMVIESVQEVALLLDAACVAAEKLESPKIALATAN